MDYLVAFSSIAQQYQGNPALKFVVDETFELIGHAFINRFGNSKRVTQEEAFKNTVDFAERVRAALELSIAKGEATAERLETAVASVKVDSFVTDATERAAETNSRLVHEYLARLLAKRLTADDDGLLAINLRRALDLLQSVTAHQLHILGLLYYYTLMPAEWQGVDKLSNLNVGEATLEDYLERFFKPFSDLQVEWFDLSHLQGLALLRISENANEGMLTNPRGSSTLMGSAIRLLGYDRTLRNKAMMKSEKIWSADLKTDGKFGLQWIDLQPTGTLLGGFVFDSLTGNVSDFSWFDSHPPAAEEALATS